MRRRGSVLITVGLVLALAGCAERRQIVSTEAPIEEELLDLEPYERAIPANIGVEGRTERPRVVLVPEFKPIEPTPEERAVLGEPEQEPEPDVLTLYRPPRGPEHGVGRSLGGPNLGIFGIGGASVAVQRVQPETGVSGVAGRYYGIFPFARSEAGTYDEFRLGAGVGAGPGGASVGIGEARSGAAAHDRNDD
jgi:hypothetical protein